MASNAPSSHNFQKLTLDTSSPYRQIASTFAAFPRHDSARNGHDRSHRQSDFTSAELSDYSNGASRPCEQNGATPQSGSYVGRPIAPGRSGSEEQGIEARFKKRTTSITFDNEVTLDTGARHALEVPVPKPISRHSQPHSERSSFSDHSEYLEMPFNQQRHMQHRVGQSRYPLLQTTVDDLANDQEYNDQVASLTSDATASPLEEARTPLEMPSEYMLSPLPVATSPIEFPGFSPRMRGPPRTKSFRSEIGEDGSLRRTSRRSSVRSGRSLSSMSPAASFLARYRTSEAAIKPSEPDDEGQGVGYEGEYIIGKQIGYGGFSIVKEVTSIEHGKPVVHAVKIVRKLQQHKSELENEEIQTQFDHEVEIWRFLRHPYILPLLRVYTTDFATFCITKLNKGGTLFDLVRDTRRKKHLGLPRHLVKRYAYQLASALRYLHNDVQVVHRDVKLENCLVDMTIPNAERDGGDVLLCDFGMADYVVSDQRDGPEPHSIGVNQNIGPADTSTCVAGSLQYAAPELFDAPGPVFSTAADMWAFGVCIYALLTATLPFNEGLDVKTTMKIMKGEWDAELIRSAEAVKEGGVEDALALIAGCLEMDVEKRWTVHDVLECAWLRDCEQCYENVARPWLNGS
ncbi:kinase-like protein [Dothidotthia symphoricarpi CBS 119687]|uniref:Kinase-like protein n=1 Tax=Dothidotthia symphoricarpi CBS 119687 TaxID=1392245 RepID=A0A6A6A608_9PLEO|nr:kinase-like protein [Dothidotthia symphoricarpi CBS 119687]KAF2126514.1 kinase-like protein [Dothidotthia symphoricarpi CBS 119687]